MEPVYDHLLGSATTVVMKLLLLALDLKTERTKDSGHQLSTNLALAGLQRLFTHHSCRGGHGTLSAKVKVGPRVFLVNTMEAHWYPKHTCSTATRSRNRETNAPTNKLTSSVTSSVIYRN
jgi:hypothetical protein